jgi:hypothetical protein
MKKKSFQHTLYTNKKDLIKFKKNDCYYGLLIAGKTFSFLV